MEFRLMEFVFVEICHFKLFLKNVLSIDDQSPSLQRIVATNPDLSYPSDCNSGLLIGCHSSESEVKTCGNFFAMKEKRIAEQLTRLDTVCCTASSNNDNTIHIPLIFWLMHK